MSVASSHWLAPAKINLFLHILGRREDGYHELQTVFQFLDVCDEIEINCRYDGEIHRTTEVTGVSPQEDLTVRAARVLQRRANSGLGADIAVRKAIPMGAGLGGGSSDCATVLLALNQLWGLQLPVDEVAALGRTLGADVPVFVKGKTAWGEGIGESLTPLALPECWYLVIVPDCEVSTATVFSAPSLTRNSTPMTISAYFGEAGNAGERETDIFHLLKQTRNDCEALVKECYAPVNAVLRWATKVGPARMTGTGGAVFVPLRDEQQAKRWAQRVPRRWRAFAVRSLNESPVLGQIERLGLK